MSRIWQVIICAAVIAGLIAGPSMGATHASSDVSHRALATSRGAGCVPHKTRPTINRRYRKIEGFGWAVCRRKPANLVLHVLILRYSSASDTSGDVMLAQDIPIENPDSSAKHPDKFIVETGCKRDGWYVTAVRLEVFQPPIAAAYPDTESARLHVTDKKQCRYN